MSCARQALVRPADAPIDSCPGRPPAPARRQPTRRSAAFASASDYSKAEYDLKWSADVWWNKDVIVYGDASLKKDHPVVAFLSADK